MNNNTMQQIIYEDIVAPANPTGYSYGRGKYGDFEVIIMKETGYINASALCTSGGKIYSKWSRYNRDKIDDLTSFLAQEAGDPIGSSTIEIGKTHTQIIRGTYVHQDLVPHIASWISTAFAFRVSRIVNNHLIREAMEELASKNQRIEVLEAENERKQTTIDEIREELRLAREERLQDRQRAQEERQRAQEERQRAQEERVNLGDLVTDVRDDLTDQLNHVQSKFDTAVIHRVPPCVNEEKNEYFMLIVLNPGEYKAVRGQKSQIDKMKKRYKNKRFIEFEEHPNAVNLLNRIRERQEEIGITVKNTTIYINDLSETQFLGIVENINDEKKEVQTPIEEKPDPVYTQSEFEKLTMKDLRDICRENNLRGYSQHRKAELIQFMLEHLSN